MLVDVISARVRFLGVLFEQRLSVSRGAALLDDARIHFTAVGEGLAFSEFDG